MSEIGIAASGAILLGPAVTCDGFHIERRTRIQTHWHTDHMSDFGPSKRGDLVMTPETKELLSIAHPDLQIRANVHVIQPGTQSNVIGNTVRFEKSTHCLGAVQAAVRLEDGRWVGYSGDFSWPLPVVIEVDELVVDATYGDPARERYYSQMDAESALIENVNRAARTGAVHILAQGGTVERALSVLYIADILEDLPVVGGARFCQTLDIHRKLGYPVPEVLDVADPAGLNVIQNGRYIRIWGQGQAMDNDALDGVALRLTKYRTRDVVEQITGRLLNIGFSNHADFAGTMAYIERSKAKFVLTDATRSSPAKARALAAAVTRELGIEASAADPIQTYEYGR